MNTRPQTSYEARVAEPLSAPHYLVNERALIEQARSSDHAAFQGLYEANVGVVFGFLRGRVSHEVAEDLTAETFCRAYEHLDSFEWRGVPLRAWLLRIAYHLVVARSRRKETGTVPLAEIPEASVPSHEDRVADGLDQRELLVALAHLPPSQQTVLELRFFQDLSVGETAAVLDSTEEAVRALTYRALTGLRAAGISGRADAKRKGEL